MTNTSTDAPKKPPNFPWVSAYMTVRNLELATDFYQKAFGFRLKELVPGDDGIGLHAEMFYRDELIMFGKEGAYGNLKKAPVSSGCSSPVNLYIYCDDVDSFYANALKNNATPVSAPENVFWGDRMCCLKDPDGYEWVFATFQGECKQK